MSLNKVKFSYPGLMPVTSPKEESVVYTNDDGSARLLVKSQPTADATPAIKTFIRHAADNITNHRLYDDNTYVITASADIDLDTPQWLNNATWAVGFTWNDTTAWEDTDTIIPYNGTTLKTGDLPAEGTTSNNYFLSFPADFFNPGTSELDVTVNGETRRLVVNRTIKRNTV